MLLHRPAAAPLRPRGRCAQAGAHPLVVLEALEGVEVALEAAEGAGEAVLHS